MLFLKNLADKKKLEKLPRMQRFDNVLNMTSLLIFGG